ncbi:MAG: TIGR03617 family F420-dependent LLM class oxidoreductase [Anaerolineales bacterium]
MKIDAQIAPSSLSSIPEVASGAEQLGFDAIWSSETQHDPFLPLALVSEHTERMRFGTSVAIGFARSPATLAYTAWDLAEASKGRFILGLGTQVKPHIERRFGMPWPDSPVGKLRELIEAVRAFWQAWQTGERLNYRSEHYKLTLMSPFFNPGPIDHPDIPIYIAGVNTGLSRLAGEVADGFHAHVYHSTRYLREVVRPAINEGAMRANRSPNDILLSTAAFAVTRPEEAEFVRSQIAFYASTPTYHPVMELHGWGETAERLQGLARKGAWEEMAQQIDDEMLNTFAVVCEPAALSKMLIERYEGLVDRLALYIPYVPGQRDEEWNGLLEGVRAQRGSA